MCQAMEPGTAMRQFAKLAGMAVLMASLPVASQAMGTTGDHSCPQSLAGYQSSDNAILIEFAGTDDGLFRVLVEEADGPLDGFVYPGDAGDNEAVVLNNCPDGDATGEELEACVVWQGTIKSVDNDGKDQTLPMAVQPAADIIRMAGLVEALQASEFYEPAPSEVVSGDDFALSACQE